MSSLRPGTVDYSKWENLSVSDSEDEEDHRGDDNDDDEEVGEEYDSSGEEEEEEYDSDESLGEDDSPPMRGRPNRQPAPPAPTTTTGTTSTTSSAPPKTPGPSLAVLQRAWNTSSTGNDISTDRDDQQGVDNKKSKSEGNGEILCAACAAPNPRFRCSRCQMVNFCDQDCQIRYHPIHKSECINASMHMAYWGFLNRDSNNNDKSSGEDDERKTPSKEEQRAALQKSLEARLTNRRRRALKRAAAAAAVERARMARLARGNDVHNKEGGNKGKDAAEKEEVCSVCQCEFTVSGDSGVGLCCPASHHMCAECAGVYVKSVLGDLEASYPPRCPLCRAEMPQDHFEAQLTTQQQASLKAFTAQRALKPGQVLVKCSKCEFFEVQPVPGSVVWWCGGCDLGTCFVCNKDLPSGVFKYDIEKSPHAICKALRFAKTKIEQAIEEGSNMQCPGCGLAGRKDDACTHMTCPKCTTVWCYVCGLHVKDCDKALARPGRPIDDIFLHNQDWEINEKRCPMYLTQILEVDLHWLGNDWEERATDEDFEDDEKCLDYFHRFRTIQKLQQARDEIGHDDFQAVFENFDSVKNSGYNLEEVISTCTDKLIDREEYLQYHHEVEGDEEDEDNEDFSADDTDEGEGNGSDIGDEGSEHEWEAVPDAMTRAVIQEEEQVRSAVEVSRMEDEDNEDFSADDTDDGEVNGRDIGDEGSEHEWEAVPDAMTRAVIQEEEQVRSAVEASRMSAQEDELIRRVMEDSSRDD